jgi:hypothetical protein
MPAGFKYYGISTVKQSDGNKIGFMAQARNDTFALDDGLWFGDENGFELIAHYDADDFQLWPNQGAWDVNEAGWLVWMQQAGGEPTEHAAIFARDPLSGGRRRVVGPGDQLDVGGGELRTIQQLIFGPNSFPLQGNQDSLSADGLLVFTAIFTDGSNGLFVTSVVPEPSAVAASCLTLLLLGARRRRRDG